MRKDGELYKKIISVLADTPHARNDDLYLTLCIWKRFTPTRIKYDEATKQYSVTFNDILILPREDHIKRIRARIQNKEKKYPPTSWLVAKQRKMAELEWREWARLNPDQVTQR
jgi:hypothetical protein